LYADDFLRIPFRAPKVPEQQKIAAFLTAVDGRIEQLGRKKALLEATKKGVMQQLFTQTLRFQDGHGHDFPDWEEKTLKTICSTFKSGNGITADEIQDSGTYPVYGGNGLRGYTDRFTHEGEFVLIGRQGALCGNINRTSGKSYISEHAIAVAGNHLASTDWLEHRLNHMKLNRLSESSAQPGLAVNKLEKLKLLVPSLPEQTKIAGFLSALDGKIAAVGEQMRQTQAWKKGLLQQMFV
jgi:type I restriction enzyme S subunit